MNLDTPVVRRRFPLLAFGGQQSLLAIVLGLRVEELN